MRILLVEDDRTINAYLTEVLREAGFDVTPRTTAAEAIAHLQRGAPDLVIADYRLPDGVGTDVCRIARRSGVPTIVVSGYPNSLAAALDVEVDSWIPKPFDTDEFVNTVRRVLGRKAV